MCKIDKRRGKASILYYYLRHCLKTIFENKSKSHLFFDKTDKSKKIIRDKKIENQRKNLKKIYKTIELEDYGSKQQNINHKKISDIAKKTLKPQKQSLFLQNFAKNHNCKNILELGTCFGITTAYLSNVHCDSIVNTIEGCPNTSKIAKKLFKTLNIENKINLHRGKIDEVLIPVLEKMKSPPDMVFIDANHTYNATIKYFNILLKYLNENAILVIDDIYYSKGMERAWKEICDNSNVSTTIDVFFMGIVFLNKELKKENLFAKI